VDAIKARSPKLVRNVPLDPVYGPLDSGVRSVLAAPLKREGRVIGTLALYDKVAPDQFYPGSFDEDDEHIFARYVSYVERAIESALFYARARQHRSFDEETGLPNGDYLNRRIEQELTRCGPAGLLALATCRIENLDEIRRASDTIRVERLILRAAEALRGHLRDFDVLARTEDAEFSVLLPDPGLDPEERITGLARAVADDLAKDDRINHPVRVDLAFGYAVHPVDGPTPEALRARAATPRIRML
jgi:GGDEF domain-containing protein